MAHKKSYNRYFIILQQDESGYSQSPDKIPSGYAKLETKNDKCKVSYYVQNIKKDLAPYYMVLICNKKEENKIIKICSMNIDSYGRAESTYEFDEDNIGYSSLSSDSITGAAIVKVVDSDIVSVMSGFTTSDPPSSWKKFELLEGDKNVQVASEKPVENAREKTLEKAVKNNKEEVSLETSNDISIETSENIDLEKEVFESYEEKIDEMAREEEISEKNEENIAVSGSEEARETETNTNSEASEETISEDAEYETSEVMNDDFYDLRDGRGDQPSDDLGEFLKSAAQGLSEVNGIKKLNKCKWYRVNVDNFNDLLDMNNFNRYSIIYSPMVNYYPYIKKNDHYLFGLRYSDMGDTTHLVYAIPGQKSEQPYDGKTGFSSFIPKENSKDGYWLMFYDYRNAQVVVPVK